MCKTRVYVICSVIERLLQLPSHAEFQEGPKN